MIYMQSGSHGGPYNRSPGGADLKATFLNSQGQGYGEEQIHGFIEVVRWWLPKKLIDIYMQEKKI